MYTLRTVLNDGVQGNTLLGEHYTVVMKETSPKPFERTFREWFNIKDGEEDSELEKEKEKFYGFVVGIGGSPVCPLYKGQYNYIVSDNGRTFDNLSQR